MLNFESLAQRPTHFRNFTGLSVEEARKLITLMEFDWQKQRQENLKTDRERKIGGGRKLDIPEFADRLLVFLIYAKIYPTYLFLEYLFNIDQSNICRIVAEMTPIFSATIVINRNHKRVRTLEDLKEAIPDLDEVLIDATEQRINRPEKKRTRKKHHSGKKKDFTLKEQVVVTKQKIILHVSDSSPGRVHDYKYFKQTKVGNWLEDNPQIKARMDLGYEGAPKDFPKATIVIPVKRNRWHKTLTRSQKIMNTKKAKARIPVENNICNLKKFKILADKYRNLKEHYSAIFKSVCFLSNFRTLERLPA
jgi:transposase